MKRTSLYLDQSLFKNIRQLAQREEITLTELIHRLLQEGLRGYTQSHRKDYRFTFPVVKGKLNRSVNLGDRKSLYDLMDEIS